MKKGKSVLNNFKISNRLSYTLITFLVLAIVGVGVYAYANPTTGVGHDYSELQACASDGQILKTSGGAWTCAADETGQGGGGGSSGGWTKSGTSIILSTLSDKVGIGVSSDNVAEKLNIQGNVRIIGDTSGLIFPDGTRQTTAFDMGNMRGDLKIIDPNNANNYILIRDGNIYYTGEIAKITESELSPATSGCGYSPANWAVLSSRPFTISQGDIDAINNNGKTYTIRDMLMSISSSEYSCGGTQSSSAAEVRLYLFSPDGAVRQMDSEGVINQLRILNGGDITQTIQNKGTGTYRIEVHGITPSRNRHISYWEDSVQAAF